MILQTAYICWNSKSLVALQYALYVRKCHLGLLIDSYEFNIFSKSIINYGSHLTEFVSSLDHIRGIA